MMATTTPPQWDSKRAKFARNLRTLRTPIPEISRSVAPPARKIQLHFGTSFAAKRKIRSCIAADCGAPPGVLDFNRPSIGVAGLLLCQSQKSVCHWLRQC